MVISVAQLVDSIQPHGTVLFFGAGASIPSRAPTTAALAGHLASRFSIPEAGFSLSEIASLAENKSSRRVMITAVRELFQNLKPTGGLLNLPLYHWRSVFSTNFDNLVEQSYERRALPLKVYTSNFDFTINDIPGATKFFKIHGTIEKELCDGIQSRIIITEADYDQTEEYREHIYDRLKSDLAGGQLVIIGHSLADPDVREVVNRAVAINARAENAGQITLLLYSQDHDRASLFERRGINVCFGGIDEFFRGLDQ